MPEQNQKLNVAVSVGTGFKMIVHICAEMTGRCFSSSTSVLRKMLNFILFRFL